LEFQVARGHKFVGEDMWLCIRDFIYWALPGGLLNGHSCHHDHTPTFASFYNDANATGECDEANSNNQLSTFATSDKNDHDEAITDAVN
jgi:hypothetical protein